MARSIQSLTNTEAPTTDYPQGRVKDESVSGANDGTPVNEALLGDVMTLFNKLMSDAGITPNEMPDNTSNTFQLLQALESKIGAIAIPDNSITTPKIVDLNVTADKIALLSIAAIHIANNAIITRTINNSAVTLAKIQNITSSRLLGRVSGGNGAPEQLTAGQVSSLISSTMVTELAEDFANRSTPVSTVIGTNLLVNKDLFGYVNFKGTLDSNGLSISSDFTVSSLLGTLDVGYRPPSAVTFIVGGSANASQHVGFKVTIQSSGDITAQLIADTSSSTLWQISFDQIRFQL